MTRTQAVWLLTALAGVALLVVLEVASWPFLDNACTTVCRSGQPNSSTAQTLRSAGISLDAFAFLSLARDTLLELIWFGVAALIIWHRPRDRGPVVVAFLLLLFTMSTENAVYVPAALKGWQTISGFLDASILIVFGLVFPDGRFVPSWMKWVAVALVLEAAVTTVLPASIVDQSAWPGIVQVPAHVIPILVVLGAQVYRYRYVSSREQRLQIKWVLLGLGICLVGVTLLGLGYGLFPDTSKPGSLYDVAGYWGYPLVTTAIPVSVGIAMLYSSLWDVDQVINRTLVYGSLTLSLGALYLGGVIALQALARAITGQGSELAVAVVTLAVAALFNPWRRRLQAFIDRRFYRRKYDAQRVLIAFTSRLRDQVELDHLRDEILATVADAVQPEQASLWLPGKVQH